MCTQLPARNTARSQRGDSSGDAIGAVADSASPAKTVRRRGDGIIVDGTAKTAICQGFATTFVQRRRDRPYSAWTAAAINPTPPGVT